MGKKNKIRKDIICKPLEKGGIGMIDVNSFLGAMKLTWLRRVWNIGDLQNFVMNLYPKVIEMKNFGTEFPNFIIRLNENPFWKDICKHLKKLQHRCKVLNLNEFLAENIYYNINIMQDKKTVFIKTWYDAGITKIHHLINANGELMKYAEFMTAYPDVNTNFLQYEGIISSVREYQKKCQIQLNTEFKVIDSKSIQIINEGNRSTKLQLYDEGKQATAVVQWNKKYLELDWDKIFMKCSKVTNDTKLRWFQARLIHRILPTNRFLFLCKIKESPLCTFCNTEEETLRHLFWDCPMVAQLWKKFEKIIHENCETCAHLKFSEKLIIFGAVKNVSTDKVMDFLIVLGKIFIYKCKFKNICPTIEGFLSFLKLRYSDEQYTSRIYLCEDNFFKKWKPYENLFANI